MTTPDIRHPRRLHRALHTLLAGAAALLIGAVLLLWAWNLIAADLATLPRLQFSHALAAEAAFASLVTLTALLWRRFGTSAT